MSNLNCSPNASHNDFQLQEIMVLQHTYIFNLVNVQISTSVLVDVKSRKK